MSRAAAAISARSGRSRVTEVLLVVIPTLRPGTRAMARSTVSVTRKRPSAGW